MHIHVFCPSLFSLFIDLHLLEHVVHFYLHMFAAAACGPCNASVQVVCKYASLCAICWRTMYVYNKNMYIDVCDSVLNIICQLLDISFLMICFLIYSYSLIFN